MLLDKMLDLWELFSTGMESVYTILNFKFLDLFSSDIPIINIADFIMTKLGIGDWTVMDFMFGAGIPFIVIFSLTKWFIGVIT